MVDRDTRATSGRLRRRRWRSRIAAGGVLAVLASTLTTVNVASAARADGGDCPDGLQWSYYDNGGWFPEYFATQYVVDSVTPTFLVSEERSVVNATNAPITGSFTSSVTKTFSLTVSTGASVSLFGFFSANVSASITTSTSTTTGVTATAPVPPFGRIVGQYGVEAYDISYTINTYHNIGNNPPGILCSLEDTAHGTSVAPTIYTGWRVVPG